MGSPWGQKSKTNKWGWEILVDGPENSNKRTNYINTINTSTFIQDVSDNTISNHYKILPGAQKSCP